MHPLTRIALWALLSNAVVAVCCLWLVWPVMARDDGRYAQSTLKPWFDSLRSGKGPCCSDADGEETEYEIRNGRYFIPVDGVMMEVPDEALLTQANKFGRAMKWLMMENGKRGIRCFIPGSGA